MAEPFNWPLEESEVQALDLERNSTPTPDGPVTSYRAAEVFPVEQSASPLSGAPDLAVLDEIQLRLRGGQPVRSVGDQFDTAHRQLKDDAKHTRAGSTAERRWNPLSGGRFAAHYAAQAIARRYAGASRSEWRRIAHRWALLTLAVVVIIESALLAIGGFRNPVERTPQTDISADGQANVVTPVEGNTASPEDTVTWQAALAGNAAALGDLAKPRTPAAPAASAAAGPASVAAPGSVSISLPFQVEVYEDDRFVGLNTGAGIRLSPGSHRLTLVNESLRYRATQTVNISSGRTTSLTASLPTGMLQLNATPWAEVIMDGRSLGETPLGNVSVSIGPHTLVFRHPELGEQSRSVVVIAQSSTRITVDLQKQ